MNVVRQYVGMTCPQKWRVRETLASGKIPTWMPAMPDMALLSKWHVRTKRLVLHICVPDAMTPSADPLVETGAPRSKTYERHRMLLLAETTSCTYRKGTCYMGKGWHLQPSGMSVSGMGIRPPCQGAGPSNCWHGLAS